MAFTQASESTRQEYAARMNRVVDHIQKHLDDPLDLEQLAAIACFSPFHFHRLFHAWVGETLQEFVQRLRLERAAGELVFDLRKSITAIALDCGFSSSSSFARAFKKSFGASATEWRNRKTSQTTRNQGKADGDSVHGPSEVPGLTVRNKESSAMNFPLQVEVRNLPPQTIAYLRHIGPYIGDSALFQRLFGKLFAWAGPRRLMGPETSILSLFHDNPHLTPAAKHILEVAITVPNGTQADGEIGIKTVEGGSCAVARTRILPSEYAKPWDALVGDWLPGSGYQPDHRPAMEFYRNDPATDAEGKFDLEICLPVRPL
jgi:AraC family transcriptional regulator